MKRNLQFLSLLLLMIVGGASFAWAQTNLLTVEDVKVSGQDLGNGKTPIDFSTNGDNSISYTCGNEIYLELTFNTPVKLDASKAYVVLEASDTYASGKKLRNIKINDATYDQGGNANVSVKEINGHQVLLMSPLGRNGDIFTEYVNAGDGTMDLKNVAFNLKPSSGTDFTIYRIGFYDIAEIESLYSDVSLRFVSGLNSNLRLEFGGNDKQIIVNNNTITMTRDQSAVFLKSFGNLPNTYTLLNLRGLTLSDASSTHPFKKDIMKNLSNVGKVLMGTESFKYYPTLNTNIAVLGNNYYQYKDGTMPKSVVNKTDGNTSRYMSYTRQFIAGYSTMMVPFEVDPTYLATLGLTAYTFTDATAEGSIKFTKATSVIEHSTPIIIKADAAGLFLIPRGTPANNLPGETNYKNKDYISTPAINNISFVGSYRIDGVPNGEYAADINCINYGITSDGTKFAKMAADTKTTYYRAFLCDKRTSGARALTLSFDDGEGTTEIISLEAVDGLTQGTFYDLQGRRVAQPTKGLYIVSGKKVFINK